MTGPAANCAASASRSVDCAISPRQSNSSRIRIPVEVTVSIFAHRRRVQSLRPDTGARGLRTILENVLLDIMYDLPGMRNVQKVVVDDDVIQGESKPYLVYGPDESRLAAIEERRTGSDN